MFAILHDFPVRGDRPTVWEAVATPEGLEKWWTSSGDGEARVGAEWRFGFTPAFDWRGVVVTCDPGRAIEWEMTVADADWTGTRVRVVLEDHPGGLVWVRFAHAGWREANEHYRISSYCWAMYLRVLKHWVQRGETVPYARRLEI